MVTVDGSTEALGIVRFGPEALDCHVDEFRALKYLASANPSPGRAASPVASRSSAAPTASHSRAAPSS